mgnify:FL=1
MGRFSILFLTIWAYLQVFPLEAKVNSDRLNKTDVRQVVTDVAAWQIKAYPDMDKDRYWKSNGDLSWENGVFLSALASWSEFDQNKEFIEWYESVCKRNRYQLSGNANRIYFADDLAVALMYAQRYMKRQEEDIIYPTVSRLEFIMNNPSPSGFYIDTPHAKDRWSWCDALYMAPPVFAAFANITCNPRLREFMDKEYWTSYRFLFDKKEKLFYRDSSYFGKREKNGSKVFWGRGNAWVVGGLSLLIPLLPEEFTSRDRYIELFQEMMARIVTFQDDNGYWHASLLDPASYPSPETSSTGFFTFALWWGINYGLLDEDIYLPYAYKGWKALVASVHPNGMLGWVQPVGADPQKVTKDMTEVYGAGAFMLTGKEVMIYLDNHGK